MAHRNGGGGGGHKFPTRLLARALEVPQRDAVVLDVGVLAEHRLQALAVVHFDLVRRRYQRVQVHNRLHMHARHAFTHAFTEAGQDAPGSSQHWECQHATTRDVVALRGTTVPPGGALQATPHQ